MRPETDTMAHCNQSRYSPGLTAGLFVLFTVLNTTAGICFKQSGTDAAHKVPYFIVAAIIGWVSMGIIMVIYRRMNVNLAAAVSSATVSIALNLALWWIFKTDLSILQWAGIVATAGGTVLALMGGAATDANAAAEPANPGEAR